MTPHNVLRDLRDALENARVAEDMAVTAERAVAAGETGLSELARLHRLDQWAQLDRAAQLAFDAMMAEVAADPALRALNDRLHRASVDDVLAVKREYDDAVSRHERASAARHWWLACADKASEVAGIMAGRKPKRAAVAA